MADIPVREIIIGIFVVLLIGLMSPVSHGVRMGFLLALIVLGVLTFLGTASHWYLGFFH